MIIPQELITRLQNANHVVVSTGAGTSAESGVPTFREAQTGLWARYNPEELATPQAFRRNPQLVWDWYAWRRALVANAKPNPGHFALAEMARHVPKFTLITQNVDSLHQAAGSEEVLELHGNIVRTKCFDCGRLVVDYVETAVTPPHCPHCNGYLRPDVVWFGENLPQDALYRAFDAARTCDIFFTIGTSALVHPAAALPVEAIEHGSTTVEINPHSTPLTPLMTFVLTGPSGEILPKLLQATWKSY